MCRATGGVGDQHVELAGLRGLHGVERDGGGIGACGLRNHRHVVALTPNLQLLNRGARNVSPAASITFMSAALMMRASLPMVVVLPAPLTPTTSTTNGMCLLSMTIWPATGRTMSIRLLAQGFEQRVQIGELIARAPSYAAP